MTALIAVFDPHNRPHVETFDAHEVQQLEFALRLLRETLARYEVPVATVLEQLERALAERHRCQVPTGERPEPTIADLLARIVESDARAIAVKAAAGRLGVSRRTVERLVAAKDLPSVKGPRPPNDPDRWNRCIPRPEGAHALMTDHTGFRERPEYEYLLKLKAEGRPEFDKIAPRTRVALGYYEIAKKAAADANSGGTSD